MRAVLLLLAAGSLFAQEWKAGLAQAVITPREPVWMAGFASRTRPSEGVRRDLYVKALALEDRAGRVSVLVTTDTIGYTRAMAEEIWKRSGLARERLILSASHTHSGPVAGQLGRPGYRLNERDAAAARRYTAFLIESVAKVIAEARRDLRPAALSFGQGFAGFGVNRRRARLRSWPGPVDQDVPVLTVRAPGGELRAVVAGYACHATALSDYKISGDWPGYFQEEFERAHPGALAMFVAGCGADVNALPRNTEELARKYGQILAAAVDEVVRGRQAPVSGPLAAAFDTVQLPFAPPPTREDLQARLKDKNASHRNNAADLLKLLDGGGKLPEGYPYAIAVWRFAKGPRWIVLSSEVVVDYSLRLKGQYGWNDTWVSAYANDFCGYMPSLRVLKEGGYEGGEAMPAQGHPGPWGERVEELIVGKVAELVKRATPGLPYLVTIPFYTSDVPALFKNPVFLFVQDRFTRPNPIRFDVAAPIDDAIEAKLAALDAHTSQMYEWLPFQEGLLKSVPKEPKARLAWLHERRFGKPMPAGLREGLRKAYGARADAIRYAEGFEICELGRQPRQEELKKLFPF